MCMCECVYFAPKPPKSFCSGELAVVKAYLPIWMLCFLHHPAGLACLCKSLETYSPLQLGGLFYFSCICLSKQTYTGKSHSSLVGLEATSTMESSFNHASPELIREASAPSNLAFSILISTLIFNYLLLCVISNGFAMPETLQINELLNWSLCN